MGKIKKVFIIALSLIVVLIISALTVTVVFPKISYTVWYRIIGSDVSFNEKFNDEDIKYLENEFNLSFNSCEVLMTEYLKDSECEKLIVWIKANDKQNFFNDNKLNDEKNIEVIDTNANFKNHKLHSGKNGILYCLYLPNTWSIYYYMTEYKYKGEDYFCLSLTRFES